MADGIQRFRRTMVSQRAKAILDMVGAKSNHNYDQSQKTENEYKKTENIIDDLYSRPYSMESEIFKNFCETQTTLTSYHNNELQNNIRVLKDNLPTSSKNNKIDEMRYCSIDLKCHEEMPSEKPEAQSKNYQNNHLQSERLFTPLDFDSDDSVRDKDYIPSDSSDDSDDNEALRSSQKGLASSTTFRPTSTKPAAPLRLLQPLNLTEKVDTRKRRNTVELGHDVPRKLSQKRRNTIHAVDDTSMINQKKYKVTARKRKEKNETKITQYSVKPGCNNKCLKKCTANISEDQRNIFNKEYWSLSFEQRRQYVRSQVEVAVPKRKYTKEAQRNPRRTFKLRKSDGSKCEVCKIFFLTTLGFKKNNDQVLRLDTKTEDFDKRGKHNKTPAFDRQLLDVHIESFHPYSPHYRREHAPLRRYLPSDITIRYMHNDYCEKNPNNIVSYELYRKYVKTMNISFTRLGNEECETCESYNLHSKQTSHDALTQLEVGCNICVEYKDHHSKYTRARQLYKEHKELPQDNRQIFYSTDLEKVIMLPRMETFKSVIFCQRLIAFNQTFAPVGKITKENKPITVLWHDAIAGRKQEDIMSAFYAFLLRNRDVQVVNIWLDNCSAQNKNWLLFSFLIHMVNSDLISTNKISLFYFEPGHTFMSADQVHHQVEMAMKKKSKLYDYHDFVDSVSSINNSKVIVKSLTAQQFITMPNNISDRRIQKSAPRAYLKNMVQVNFKRNEFDLLYKNNFDEDEIALRFLNDKYLKNPKAVSVSFRSFPKGIEQERKDNIIQKLKNIIPVHKLVFWTQLPVNHDASNDVKNRKTT